MMSQAASELVFLSAFGKSNFSCTKICSCIILKERDLEGREEINELVRRYEERKSSRYYQAVMDLIVRANKEKMEEERYMCEALHELFAEDVEKAAEKAAEEAVEKVREELKKEARKEADRLNILNKLLAEQNRTEDIIKAATEPEYQKKLMEELL